MTRALLVVLAALALSACPKPPPHPIRPDADGAPPATCVEACNNIEHLGCNSSTRCARDCEKLQSQRLVNCIARASSCYEADECDR